MKVSKNSAMVRGYVIPPLSYVVSNLNLYQVFFHIPVAYNRNLTDHSYLLDLQGQVSKYQIVFHIFVNSK